MLEFLVAWQLSYVGIIVALVLIGVGLPIPEEAVVIVAGVASHQELLNPWLALASCLIGALAGDCVMYAIGYHFGYRLVKDHPWYAGFLTEQREQQIEELLRKHGIKAFLLARFLVGLRSPVYLTAGILRVPFRRFIAIDAFCAAIVVGLFFGLSYFFAHQIQRWWSTIRNAEMALSVLVVLGVAAVAALLLLHYRRHHSAAGKGATTEGDCASDARSLEPRAGAGNPGVARRTGARASDLRPGAIDGDEPDAECDQSGVAAAGFRGR